MMRKDNRSSINPFTGKQHHDTVDDDRFIAECFQAYYKEIQSSTLLDNTQEGQLINRVTTRLIRTVEDFLMKIGRYDYVDGYYEWEVHLTANNQINACCYPGGKVIVFAGIFQIADTEEKLAFILSHELAHALLDHGRTKVSAQQSQNTAANLAYFGSFALDLLGLGEVGYTVRAATNILSLGSQFFLMQPWGRDHEYEADKLGMIIAHLAGYDISGVPKFWQDFAGDNAQGFDFFSTHPADDKRIAVMIESEIEILNTADFYSRPVLPETPKPKDEFNPYIEKSGSKSIPKGLDVSRPNESAGTGAVSRNASSKAPSISSNTISCPNCHSQVNADSKFCTSCGTKLNQESFCEICGAPVSEGDSFCTNCGNSLKKNRCPNCGNEIGESDSFCINCGIRL